MSGYRIRSRFTDVRKNTCEGEALCGKKVKAFSSSTARSFCFAITESGHIFSWGLNTYGELGLGNTIVPLIPTLVELGGETATYVACGDNHVVAVTTNGKVFSWGYGADGQLGIASKQNHYFPIKVTVPNNVEIASAVCGSSHSCALSKTGELFTWGYNGHGQLCTGSTGNLTEPTKVDFKHSIKQVVASLHQTMILTVNGEIITFGWNDQGMLGNGTIAKSVTPSRPLLPKSIVRRIATFGKVCACQIQGDIYVWGEINGTGIEPVLAPVKVGCSSFHDAFASFTFPQAMHQYLNADESDVNYSLISTLENEILNQSGNGNDSTDVEFSVEGKRIKAHKSILVMRSDYFAARFSDPWKNHNDGPIHITEDIKCGTFWAFLFYIYTDKIHYPGGDLENILDLMLLADSFCETDLKRKCEVILQKHVAFENVFALYIRASRINAMELKQTAFEFAILHWKEISAQGLLRNCGLTVDEYPLFIEAWADLDRLD